MHPMFQRAVVGVTALIFAIATFDVGRAIAQQTPVLLTNVEATPCGAGSKVNCGHENIMHCSWRFEISFDIRTGGGIKIGRYECVKIGVKTLFKDNDVPVTGGSCVALPPRRDGGGADDESTCS